MFRIRIISRILHVAAKRIWNQVPNEEEEDHSNISNIDGAAQVPVVAAGLELTISPVPVLQDSYKTISTGRPTTPEFQKGHVQVQRPDNPIQGELVQGELGQGDFTL